MATSASACDCAPAGAAPADDCPALRLRRIAPVQRLKHWETRLRRLRNRAAPVLYAGRARHCPICAGTYRKFRAAGRRDERRPDAICPRCASRERDRLAWLFLRDLPPRPRLLHVAPEACLVQRLTELAAGGYVQADLLRPDVNERFDLLAIPHPNGTFGAVYCSHVLQDVRDDARAMAEVFRVLAPGGWAILNVPVGAARTVEHQAPLHPRARGDPRPPEHLRTYGPDFAQRMAAAGFRVRVVRAADLASATARQRCGIASAAAGAIHFGTKP